MQGPLLQHVINTLRMTEMAVVAGEKVLSRRVSDVRLNAGARMPIASADGVIVVVDSAPDVGLELRLAEFKAAGVSALFAPCEPEAILASTRWVANRLGLAIVACPGNDPVELAFRLKVVVAESDLTAGLQISAIGSQMQGKACSPQRAVEILRDTTGIECAVVGADSNVLAGSSDSVVDVARNETSPRIEVDKDQTRIAVPISATSRSDVDPDFWFTANLPLVTRAHAEGVLSAMQVLSVGLTAWAAVNQLTAQRDSTLKSAVLMQVLTSGGDITSHILEQTLALGWSLNGWHMPVCIRTTAALTEVTVNSMDNQVSTTLRREFPGIEVVRSGQGWLAWTTDRADPTALEVEAHVAGVNRAVAAIGNRVVAGVGMVRKGGSGLIEGLVEAQALASSAGWVTGRRFVEHAQSSPTRRIILDATRGASVSFRSDDLLRPLRETDSNLMATLQTYLALESSKSATASALKVHRNTVIKRLERIEEVLQLDLRDPEVRLALEIACRGRSD